MAGQPQTEVWAASDELPVSAPVMAAPVLLKLSLGSEYPLSLTAITPLCFCHPHPDVESGCWADRACAGSQCVLGYGLWWSGCCQRSGPFPMCCLCKCQKWLSPSHSDTTLGLGCLFISQPSFFLACGSPSSTVELQCDVSRAGMFTRLRLGHVLRQ